MYFRKYFFEKILLLKQHLNLHKYVLYTYIITNNHFLWRHYDISLLQKNYMGNHATQAIEIR